MWRQAQANERTPRHASLHQLTSVLRHRSMPTEGPSPLREATQAAYATGQAAFEASMERRTPHGRCERVSQQDLLGCPSSTLQDLERQSCHRRPDPETKPCQLSVYARSYPTDRLNSGPSSTSETFQRFGFEPWYHLRQWSEGAHNECDFMQRPVPPFEVVLSR